MAKVVFDSDAIFALYNSSDPLNKTASKIYEDLLSEETEFVYPSSVIFEVFSLLQRVLKSPEILELFYNWVCKNMKVVSIGENNTLEKSLRLFKPRGNRKNTLVDCSVVEIAREVGADGVFSFDEFYTKNGLKLASELVKG